MSDNLADDLAYVRGIAEQADKTPSLSGRYSLWWSGLAVLALIAHWATITQTVTLLAPNMVGLVWMTFGIVGGIGSGVIAWTLRNHPGKGAAGNKVDRYTWQVSSVGLFLFAISIAVTVAIRDDITPMLFDMILPTAFLMHAVAYAGSAAFERSGAKWVPVISSLVLAAVSVYFVGTAELYLIAAVGVILIWAVPGIGQLRNEPKPVA